MNFFNRFNGFRSEIGSLISKYFFTSQARLKQILIDYYYSYKYRLNTKEFDTTIGKIDIQENFEKPDSFRTDFSKIIFLDSVPKCVKQIVETHKEKIIQYLGNNFLYDEKINVYTTYNVPEYMSKFDLYANIWHVDNHDGFKLIRIFILLDDVTENDGPLHYMDRNTTKKNWNFIKDRWTYKNKNGIKNFEDQKKFVGPIGSYMLVNTAECAHRASVPLKERTILTATLYPSWRKKEDRKIYN